MVLIACWEALLLIHLVLYAESLEGGAQLADDQFKNSADLADRL